MAPHSRGGRLGLRATATFALATLMMMASQCSTPSEPIGSEAVAGDEVDEVDAPNGATSTSSQDSTTTSSTSSQESTTPTRPSAFFTQTQGSFTFTPADTGPDPGRAIDVLYHRPDGIDLAGAPILVVMAGNSRDAGDYRESWDEVADTYGALLLVPRFPRNRYDTAAYNRGNLVDGDGTTNSHEEWTFSVIEDLYRHVVEDLDSTTDGYHLYGHSAGAQFVHRFMLFMTDHHVLRAVSANAGWYTVPDAEVAFPYGLDGGPPVDLDRALSAPLVVMVGINDDEPDASGLRTTDAANEQGRSRYERGLYFFQEAKAAADDDGIELRWTLQIVPGVGHSNHAMAPAAAKVLLSP